MKAKVICIVSFVVFMLISGSAPLTAQTESKEQLIKFYESCIQKKITCCNAKVYLKTSRSVRRTVVLRFAPACRIFLQPVCRVNPACEESSSGSLHRPGCVVFASPLRFQTVLVVISSQIESGANLVIRGTAFSAFIFGCEIEYRPGICKMQKKFR